MKIPINLFDSISYSGSPSTVSEAAVHRPPNKVYYILFLLLLIASSKSIAQKMVVPGYQGKKILVGLNFEGMSSLEGYNSNGATADAIFDREGLKDNAFFALSGRVDITGAYVLSRRMTATINLGTGKAGLANSERLMQISTGAPYSGISLYNFRYNYAAIALQLHRKKRWGIAPIGPYWGIRYQIAQSGDLELIKAERSEERVVVPVSECDCSLSEEEEQFTSNVNPESQIAHSFQVQFGSRRIIKDHFYYDLSMTLDPIYLDFLTSDTAKEKMNNLFALNVRVGVGMLF